MIFSAKINLFIHFPGILAMVLAINSCEPKNQDNENPNGPDHLTDFPAFITPSEKYFDVRSNGIPDIDPDSSIAVE